MIYPKELLKQGVNLFSESQISMLINLEKSSWVHVQLHEQEDYHVAK